MLFNLAIYPKHPDKSLILLITPSDLKQDKKQYSIIIKNRNVPMPMLNNSHHVYM
ncbi:protein of unknown function [Candidatus Nitrosocosmicus franklandus]|uniref:Uncharacterized protein n=1 Tax=Candidatus Nitrosocosmicus franklandianus TaxID=1798806 RepID=A0A484IB77_9ARCH|nr:protein of unknown function [Candidatus Nitrosocosmicus franklandus]